MLALLGSLAALRTVESLLFQIEPTDVQAWLGVSGVLLAVVLSASALPAWIAARVEPVRALRRSRSTPHRWSSLANGSPSCPLGHTI